MLVDFSHANSTLGCLSFLQSLSHSILADAYLNACFYIQLQSTTAFKFQLSPIIAICHDQEVHIGNAVNQSKVTSPADCCQSLFLTKKGALCTTSKYRLKI